MVLDVGFDQILTEPCLRHEKKRNWNFKNGADTPTAVRTCSFPSSDSSPGPLEVLWAGVQQLGGTPLGRYHAFPLSNVLVRIPVILALVWVIAPVNIACFALLCSVSNIRSVRDFNRVGGFGVYLILGNTWSSWIGTRNEVRSRFSMSRYHLWWHVSSSDHIIKSISEIMDHSL